MGMLKRKLKNIFYATGNARVLDRIIYQWSAIQYGQANRRYKKNHPGIALPPHYFLYETYMPEYEKYMEDGRLAAKEIIEWTSPYFAYEPQKIMEWGCGVSRIIRHVPDLLPGASLISACDINEQMTQWNRDNIQGIEFSIIGHTPPTPYPDGQFNLIYAISVFTHIEGNEHLSWIREIHRILSKEGIFLFTTHGEHFNSQLTGEEITLLRKGGYFTRSYPRKGHRMMTAYNDAAQLKIMVSALFEVMEYHDGHKDYDKTGGQDLWILRKKN